MIVVTNKDPMDVATFEEAIINIESCLFNLKYLAVNTDFSKPEELEAFKSNVDFTKRFYERAEKVLLA